MSDSFFDSLWTAKVTVPVKRVGEHWEFFYGGDVPVKDGTLGELSFDAEQISDESFFAAHDRRESLQGARRGNGLVGSFE